MLEDASWGPFGVESDYSSGIKSQYAFEKESDLKKKKVIVIAGPTGVGKTQLSLVIARAIGGEIVSADSMQVYRGMDIGTAKPSFSQRGGIPHHLIDSRDLDEGFNVAQYYREALCAIREIFDRGSTPIVVGGTGFYIHALLYGPPMGPSSHPLIRRRLEDEMDVLGTQQMYERLQAFDPEYARSITPKDRHKIVRALEIIILSSKKVSSFNTPSAHPANRYDFRCWFLHMTKEILYARVEKRCDEMIEAGLIDEIKTLQSQGLRKNSTASSAIGYKQCLEYLDSRQTPEDYRHFVDQFKRASRRFVKRQMTWFRKEEAFRWIDAQQFSSEQVAEVIIQDFETRS